MFGKIGCRTHDYGQGTMAELATRISPDGYETMQLALKKALTDVEDLLSYLTDQNAEAIHKALEAQNLTVSVLGAYLNYAGTDGDLRGSRLDILKGHLKIAKTLGARMVGTETGSINDDYTWNDLNHGPDAFETFKASVTKVMPLTEEYDTYFAVEAVSTHIIHTPERMNALVRAVDHERLKVIFDISNLMTPENQHQQDDMIIEMFKLLGDKIWAVHVKDFDFEDGKKVIVPLGTGKLNIDLLLKQVSQSPEVVDMMAEDVRTPYLASSCALISKKIEALR